MSPEDRERFVESVARGDPWIRAELLDAIERAERDEPSTWEPGPVAALDDDVVADLVARNDAELARLLDALDDA